MAETTYTYTKSGVIPHILQAEIIADTNITVPITYVLVNQPDDLRIVFSDALSAGEKTELDGLVSSHPQTIPEEEGSTNIPTGGYPEGYVPVSDGASGTTWLDINSGIVNHATLSGLGSDSHLQYHNDTRGDARYYTQTQLTNGQLDSRYYTEVETDSISGAINSKFANYYTSIQVDTISGSINTKLDNHKSSADHDSRYYTETELNNGQLDNRYYTETETDVISGALNTRINNLTFLNLADTPDSYVGQMHRVLTVNLEESALEFNVISGSGTYDHSALSNLGYAASGHTGFVPSTRTITTNSGIQGGGDLSADRILRLDINGLTSVTAELEDFIALYDTSTGNTIKATISGVMFGAGAAANYYSESDGESNTSSATYQTKVTITTGAIRGTFRLGYSCEFRPDASNKTASIRIYNNTDALEYAQSTLQTNNSNNWFPFSGFKYVTFTGVAKTFYLQYAAGTANCYIRNARLDLRRTS